MSMNAKRHSNAKTRRLLQFESMESRRLLAADVFQHNFDMAEDVNGDKFVSPMDALVLINKLNASRTAANASPSSSASLIAADVDQFFMDVNDDGFVSPMDALSVINMLNAKSSIAAPSTTPTTATPVTPTAPVSPNVDVDQQGEYEGQFGDDNGPDDLSEVGEAEFVSVLQGTGSQLGYVQFETELKQGTTKSQLGISVNSLKPNSTVDVVIAGITVGQIQTDANGHGDLDLSSLPRGPVELPLPANMPTVATGTKVSVGNMTGTFAVFTDSSDGDKDDGGRDDDRD